MLVFVFFLKIIGKNTFEYRKYLIWVVLYFLLEIILYNKFSNYFNTKFTKFGLHYGFLTNQKPTAELVIPNFYCCGNDISTMLSCYMKNILKIATETKIPKYLQIVLSIIEGINFKKIKKGDPIQSINDLSDEFQLSRDTVQKAYNILRKKGVIVSVRGKGFYINRTDIATPYRILLLFNKISNYKRQIYHAFVQTMGEQAMVDLKIHHFNLQRLEELIQDAENQYDYFVIMPHFHDDKEIYRILKKIPPEQLIILDKDLPNIFSKYAGVFQDFKNDIYNALESAKLLLQKYQQLILVFPEIVSYPKEIIIGFKSFCLNNKIAFNIIDKISAEIPVQKNAVYIVIEETDLVNLIKSCKNTQLTVGKDIGIISYNESPLKEILLNGISVISTDHQKMGETAAKLILEHKKEKIKNPFVFIHRNSL